MKAFGTRQRARGGSPDGCWPSGRGTAPYGGEPDRARRRALMVLPALLALGACGQKGSLFLPEEGEERQEARGVPTPVAAA